MTRMRMGAVIGLAALAVALAGCGGSDDNASGTAGLIELARIFGAQKPKLKRTLIFIAFLLAL